MIIAHLINGHVVGINDYIMKAEAVNFINTIKSDGKRNIRTLEIVLFTVPVAILN